MERVITEEKILQYQEYLYEEEKTTATIKKYMCDLKKLMGYLSGREVTKKLMVEYKEILREERGYRLTSINSFLVAANRFFEYMGWYDLRVKTAANPALTAAAARVIILTLMPNGDGTAITKHGTLGIRFTCCAAGTIH